MAAIYSDNINFIGNKPNFERDRVKTLAQLLAEEPAKRRYPFGHIVFCEEDNNHYKFNYNYEVPGTTSKNDVTGWFEKVIALSLSQTTGDNTGAVMSQAAVSAELDALDDKLDYRTAAILGRISQVSRANLNSGESMSLNIPPILTGVTIQLRAAINISYSGVIFSIANAVISISKESVRIVIDGKESNIELDWDDYYGEFFQDFIFVDFRLQPNKSIRRCDMYIKSRNNCVDIFVGSLTVPMRDGITVSVSGSLLAPVLLVEQPISPTVLILDYADRVDYTDRGVTIAGYSGITSATAVALFDSILMRGRPDTAVWFVGAAELDEADANEIYIRNLDAFVEKCKLYGVRPILCTIPNTPNAGGLHIAQNDSIRRFSDKATIVDLAIFINGSTTGVTCPNGFWDAANNTVSEDGITLMYNIINSYL